ncbi:MAG: hypothetical protein LQ343_005091 [Gyalolechia ehrenbergii]|nr:MAG: hypothetical protein LQ343_005091 [Gyalolechia ehrenbergii]
MNGVRTRKKPAEVADEADRKLNGHANPRNCDGTSNEQSENVFLFVPNLIGYSRIFLAIASLYYMPLHPRTCSLLYSISCLLDALDGVAARQFNQSTRFGAVLDMVTDRCTTSCLLVFLSSAFPRWALLFQGLISLDFASHYMHMYATLAMGGSEQSHKKIDQSRSRLLHLYYNNRTVLFVVCALNELFFIALYLLSFSSPILSPSLLPMDDKPGVTSQPGNPSHPSSAIFATPGSAWAMELARANKMDSFWPWVLAGVSLPVMAGKQILNIIQLVKASKWLAEGDIEARRALGLPKKSDGEAMRSSTRACRSLAKDRYTIVTIIRRRPFHDYFVTHLPSSSLHPDSRPSGGPHHQLPRSASKPHDPKSSGGPSPAPLLGANRDTTVVRIPLRSAKHHFGAALSRGQRPYNEDTYQAGVIEVPAFAKRAPINLTRAPASSPLQAYREGQRRQQEGTSQTSQGGEATSAEGASGDPQVFYFGVFDGHGGTECSGFLKEKLHKFVEESAQKYALESSLRGRSNRAGPSKKEPEPALPVANKSSDDTATEVSGDGSSRLELRASSDRSAPFPTSEPANGRALNPTHGSLSETPSSPSGSGTPEDVSSLQKKLMDSWRETVGGYFRRFSPAAFALKPPTIVTVLNHAFLNADLSFITAQLKLTRSDSDPVLADSPINTSDIVPYGPYTSPQAHFKCTPSHLHAHAPASSRTPFKGGSTASVALISTPSPTPFWHPSTPSTILTAHCGDTRILLSRTSDGLAIPLTTTHHPSSPSEASRLRRHAASFVTDSFGEERMSGLANTRSFGDMPSKRMGVSAEPQCQLTQLAPAEYAFMVLVTDGVTNEASDQEIVDIVKECRTPEEGAKAVVAFATETGKEGDNATCLVVRLGGWERRIEGGGGSLRTKEGRDWRRAEAEDPRRTRT